MSEFSCQVLKHKIQNKIQKNKKIKNNNKKQNSKKKKN